MTDTDNEMRLAEAKHNLAKAITDYCSVIQEAYVADWAVLVHIETPESMRADRPIFGIITAPDQSPIVTRGLIDIAEHRW